MDMEQAEIIRRVQIKWPGYGVAGAGEIAVVRHCSKTVVLCSMPMEANAVVSEKCYEKCNLETAPWGRWHVIAYKKADKQRMVLDRTGYGDDE
jgi:hypothetical protein